MSSGKVVIIRLTVEQIKKTSLHKKNFYAKTGSPSRNKIKNELNFSNYAKNPNQKARQTSMHENLIKS